MEWYPIYFNVVIVFSHQSLNIPTKYDTVLLQTDTCVHILFVNEV